MVADLNISELLDSSRLISKEDKQQLSLLKDEFPWSEIIQVLYLKSLKDTQDIRFSDELKRVALISHDRSKLYYFLYGAEIQETIDKVESEMAALPESDGLISPDWDQNTSPAAELEPAETTPAEIPELKLSPEIGLTPLADLEGKEELKENTEEFSEPTELKAQEELLETDPVKEPFIHEELAQETIQEVKNENKSSELKEISEHAETEPVESLEQLKSGKENESTEEIQKTSDTDNKLNQLIISEAVDSVIVKDVMDDMHEKRSSEQTILKETAPNKTSRNISSDEFIAWLVNNAKAVNYPSFEGNSKTNSAPNVEQIIEKFIQTEPQIRKGKAKEYEKGNLAASSLVDKEEFVTETLAEIYVSQGNNSKAKRAFQLLSLKYPEKSIYFAARIKQLGRKK